MIEFLERLGHEIVQAGGTTWYDVQPRVLMSVPYFRTVTVEEEVLKRLMRERSLRAIRFPTDQSQLGFESTVALLTDPEYSFQSQHAKSRNQTRRGLENCTVERIEPSVLLREGMMLNLDTADRQGLRNQYVNPEYWKRFCRAADQSTGVAIWSAFWKGRLAAFLVAVEVDGWVEWIVNHSLTEARQVYANNALVYEVARHYLTVSKCEGVGYGLGSLEPTPELDHFKERMGWKLMPIKQRLVLSLGWRMAASMVSPWVKRRLGASLRGTYAPRKALVLLERYNMQRMGTASPDEPGTKTGTKPRVCG